MPFLIRNLILLLAPFATATAVAASQPSTGTTLRGLFDLRKDPGEKEDLSGRHPDILARVRARWENWEREMEAAEPRGPFRNY